MAHAPSRRAVFLIALTLAGAATAQTSPPAGLPELDLAGAGPIDLLFDGGVLAQDAYRAVGKALGVDVIFDPKLRDQRVELQMRGVDPARAFEIIGRAVGHFHTVIDARTVLIADDTPQNRRTYDEQVVQTFYLEHADYRDVMTMIRSLIGVKHVAADETLDALVIRDTAAKVRVAEEIIRSHDKPPAMVAIDVALLEVDAGRLAALGGEGAEGGAPLTVDAAAMERIRNAAGVRPVTRAQLSARSKAEAELALEHRVPSAAKPAARAAHGNAGEPRPAGREPHAVGLELRVEPIVHTGHDDLTLKVRLRVDYLDDPAPAGEAPRPVPTTRRLASEVRLGEGETVVLSALWSLDGCPSATSDRTLALLASRACAPEDATARHLLVALTPRVTERPEITDRDRAPIGIGTEAHIDFPHRLGTAID